MKSEIYTLLIEQGYESKKFLLYEQCHFRGIIASILRNTPDFYKTFSIEWWVCSNNIMHCYIFTDPLNKVTYYMFHDFSRNLKFITTCLSKQDFKSINISRKYDN